MKISNAVFLGSKKFGFEIFRCMYLSEKAVKWTIICPDDKNDTRTYLNKFKNFANKNNIKINIFNSKKRTFNYLKKKKYNLMIVCGYYEIIPFKVLSFFDQGVWGIHNSLLPKYRGGSPLVWQIINGEREIGSSFFKFSKGIDNGPIYKNIKISNLKRLNINQISKLIENRWKHEIPKFWKSFCEGKFLLKKQNEKKATFFKIRNEKDGLINWTKRPKEIDNFIKAQVFPYPGAHFFIKNLKIKIISYIFIKKQIKGTPGKVYKITSNYILIICRNNSLIKITKIGKINGQTYSFKKLIKFLKI